MKIVAIAVWCVALVGSVCAEIVPIYRPSPPNLEVIVMCKGKPAAQVPVTFNLYSRPGDKSYWSGSTDANGRLFPPKLSPGKYYISAETGKRYAELYINVTERKTERATFVMKLYVPFVGKAEDALVTTQVSDFHGVVLDPAGAVLSQTEIKVLRKDDLDAGVVLQLRSDEKGEFSGHLNRGAYVALFYSPGFSTYVAVFEVTTTGEQTLRVTLQIGSVAYNESLKGHEYTCREWIYRPLATDN